MEIKQDDAALRGHATYGKRGENWSGPYDVLEWASFVLAGPDGWVPDRVESWLHAAKNGHVKFKGEKS